VDPLQDALDDLRKGSRGVDSDVCLTVRRTATSIQLFHLDAIGRKRPAAVSWNAFDDAVERHVEPRDGAVRQHGGAILRIHERAASRRDDRVPLGKQILQHSPLDVAEIRLALSREDLRDALMLARFDAVVDILDAPAHTAAECPRHARLARAHEANQIQLVSLHARSDSSTVKNSGYDTPAEPASWITVGPVAPSAAIAKAMASRWSFFASTSPPRSRLRPRTWNPSVCSSISPPIRRSPSASVEMRSLSLTRNSPAPDTLSSPPWVASAASTGKSSLPPGNSSGLISVACRSAWRTRMMPIVSPACACSVTVFTSAPIRRRISRMPVRVGLRPTCSMVTSEPGS